ncbi:FAD-dependent oxidoreductase [Motiliproteus sp. MSK22-1]|uniref:oxidoreductase n=1 Tax=Motiliproteus sp. MSK22-1 TaxID=1897630 RepID=UPI0009778153|nr:FAD-dependent oxidoreductase [Motiliproteus sp. MSK22-1]OMH36255.1 oxidoreductase [Motiliproteus sp. MSK22-1]
MDSRYLHLFKPMTLRHKVLRNRITFGAHTANMAENGLPGDRHLGYYLERAMGGAAMIVVEPMPVHQTGVLTRGNFRHSDDAVIPYFRRITDACHEQGTVMIQQLYHVGQHGDADNSYSPNWSASGMPSYHDSDGSHAMTGREIEELISGFIQAAVRCQKAGFDGVELWAAYHALLDQFWTPWSNRRDDKWGGSLENRTRLSREICAGIRKACGEDFIIGMAVNDEPDFDVTLGREALAEVIARHDQDELVDYVTCGTGSYLDFYKLMPTVFYPDNLGVELSEILKSSVSFARIQAESHIRTPDNADYVIGSGQADLVSIVRGQIADPHLVNKAREGRSEDIRGCLSCNQMCWGRRSRDYWISCLINPSAGREFEWGGDRFIPTDKVRNILVVGAGPAGLECARVAAERGHQVTLCEASGELGGQFRLAGKQPRRAQILELMEWYAVQLEKLQVDLRYYSPVDVDDIQVFKSEVVVLATGSQPAGTGYQKALPQFETLAGIDKTNVWSVEEVMSKSARLGKHVLLLDEGGNWRGCGTALYLLEQRYQLTIVTPDPVVGKELARTAADFPLRKKLKAAGVRFMVESAITEWTGSGAKVLSLLDGSVQLVEADTLVLATTNQAEDSVYRELSEMDSDLEIHSIGDCVASRQAPYAFYEGRKFGLAL